MIQLHTASQTALSEEAELCCDEFVELGGLVSGIGLDTLLGQTVLLLARVAFRMLNFRSTIARVFKQAESKLDLERNTSDVH